MGFFFKMKLFAIIATFCVINSALAASWPQSAATTTAATTNCYGSGVTSASTCIGMDGSSTSTAKCCSIVFAATTDPHVSDATSAGPTGTAYQCYKLGGNLMLTIGSNVYETAGNQFCKSAHTAAVTGSILYSDLGGSTPTDAQVALTINTAGTITSCSCAVAKIAGAYTHCGLFISYKSYKRLRQCHRNIRIVRSTLNRRPKSVEQFHGAGSESIINLK